MPWMTATPISSWWRLRSLAALGAPESFPVLRERLHAVAQGKSPSPPLQALQAAMASFDLTCAPALLPSLRHPDRQIRLCATEILRTMVRREAARQPRLHPHTGVAYTADGGIAADRALG